ncbi:MAG: response regulator [ANME-2 cluster archaeon]|jgi:two-component system cell cycle response regulator DivK|nr:response regulator [ANME-2 cluster archaeon]
MRALVVEDNPANMKLITKVLKKRGYETIHAICGEDGVKKAASEHPDIILMDILLPDIDGLETTRRIRKIESLKDTPIIAITSYAMAGDREKIIEAGCNGYFEKPINPLTIMDEIEKII